MKFDKLFDQVKKKLAEGDTVQMTPAQFEHMLQQFYKAGIRHGKEQAIALMKLTKGFEAKPKNPFEGMFGGL